MPGRERRLWAVIVAALAMAVVAGPPSSANTDPVDDPVLVGAGDIATCTGTNDSATADLLDDIPGTVFTAGDHAYDNGTAEEFTDCYEPTWGRHRARTRPAAGNHDYYSLGAIPYYEYFGDSAGAVGQGYYSYDLGAWHVVALNSNIPVNEGSAQEQWLRADLAANPADCTVAYWHHPLFSSGSRGGGSSIRPIWDALYAAGVDVVLNGHDHSYERFDPQTPAAEASPNGPRQFVVGTGGIALRSLGDPRPNSVVREDGTWGVLKLTLHATSYDWEFVPIAGQTFTDSGTAACVDPGPPAPVSLVVDGFGRSVVGGWGAADLGGSYGLTGTRSDFSVAAGAGVVRVPAGGTRSALLQEVSQRDVEVAVRVRADKAPAGGSGQFASVVGRRVAVSSGSPQLQYRGRLRLLPGGGVEVAATKVTAAGEVVLAPPVRVAGVASAVDSAVWLRLRLQGADPTVVRVKAWADGATEPSAWSVVAEDAEVGLQAPGAVGVRASLPGKASNAPVTLRFDDLHATIPDEASPGP